MRDLDKSRLFLEHIIKVATHVKQLNRQPIMWDDMLRDIEPGLIRCKNAVLLVLVNMLNDSACHLSDYVEPMIWNYTPLLNLDEGLFGCHHGPIRCGGLQSISRRSCRYSRACGRPARTRGPMGPCSRSSTRACM